jgi:methyl-accepting chemotaxis protein
MGHATTDRPDASEVLRTVDLLVAVAQLSEDGTVVDAGARLCELLGRTPADLQGRHLATLLRPDRAGAEGSAWERLLAGPTDTAWVHADGSTVWLKGECRPLGSGVLYAAAETVEPADNEAIAAAELARAEVEARLAAVDRAQAVIEFDLEGNVLAANDNFLRAMGYTQREVVGQHHSMFCTEEHTRSVEYRDFWLRLGKGEVIAGRFHRRGKYARDVYIQATYNPVLDLAGDPVKIVKYAYDVTSEVDREHRVARGAEQMTETVRALADSIDDIASESRTATELASQTHNNAEQGVEALRASIEAIRLIQRSSGAISDIAKVISSIAEQTNLLAFNASIEAARAGEHGVGFSIVAGEVRKLAERSSQAASEIGELIAEAAERVDQGSDVSRRAENAFERIVTSVVRTNEAILAISGSTKKQQRASERVNELIAELATDR